MVGRYNRALRNQFYFEAMMICYGMIEDRLKSSLESLDAEAVQDTFTRLKEWCEYRNEIIHALMNKNINSLESQLAEKAVDGMLLAREIDSFVKVIKNEKIRRFLNLQTER